MSLNLPLKNGIIFFCAHEFDISSRCKIDHYNFFGLI